MRRACFACALLRMPGPT
ncbi:hypothetical protein EIU44_19545 [Salmonella enterica]|nr:hypothetical protein [Salmonella enterica]ECE6873916.1 hypothetical protein [Salmonella enterica subsp. houtenae]ECQ7538923.1 hypothetical protein [Salmonella enterica]EDW0376981.1 hypothetical protein [Salmonella enterica subsp. houtenae]MFE80600.1 hypothetical protein [Salmonella enterica]